MTMILRSVLALAALALAACEQKPAVDRSPNRFPGFAQAGPEGDAANFYYEPDSIRRNARGWVDFKLIRLVPDGYVVQAATTDCRFNFRGLEGEKFRGGGASLGRVAADIEPIDFHDQPPLAAAVAGVCAKAEENRTLVGAFDDAKALEMLYGPYRAEFAGAVQDRIEAPAGSAEAQAFVGKPGIVRILASESFIERGQTKHVLLTGTRLKDEADCPNCGQLVAAAVFVQDGDRWRLESEYPGLDVFGTDAEAPAFTWQRIGHDRYAFVAKAGEVHEGVASAFIGVYELADAGWKPLLIFNQDAPRKGEPLAAEIRFGEPDQAYADATVEIMAGKAKPRQETFRFENGVYVRPRAPTPPAPPPPPTPEEALLGYAAAINARDPAMAVEFWQQPTSRIRKTVAGFEALALDIKRVDREGDRAVAWAEMTGTSKGRTEASARVGVELARSLAGPWRIVSMTPYKCSRKCVFPPAKTALPAQDPASAAKSALRAYVENLGRKEGAAPARKDKKPATAFERGLQGKESAQVNQIGEPALKDGKANVWVDLTLKGKGKGGASENWQGSIRLQQAGAGWVVEDVSGLARYQGRPGPLAKPKTASKPTAGPAPKPESAPKPKPKPKPKPASARPDPAEPGSEPADAAATKPRTPPAAKAAPDRTRAPEPVAKPGSNKAPGTPAKPGAGAAPGSAAKAGSAAKPGQEAKPKPAADAKSKPRPAAPAPRKPEPEPYRRPRPEDEPDPNIPSAPVNDR
jgi:cell division septation protein DedD